MGYSAQYATLSVVEDVQGSVLGAGGEAEDEEDGGYSDGGRLGGGHPCWAPGDAGWWGEAKKLAADIKRRAVARVLTDEDLGEVQVGEELGEVEMAEGLIAGEDCDWGAAWESMGT